MAPTYAEESQVDVLLLGDTSKVVSRKIEMLEPLGIRALTRNFNGPLLDLKRSYSAIVLEAHPPEMKHHETIRKLCGAGIKIPIVVLAVSDLSDDDDQVECLEVGAIDYQRVSISADVLAARIRAHSQSVERRRGGMLTIGNLCINLDERSITHHGFHVEISAYIYNALIYLAKADGPRNKQQVAQGIYGRSEQPTSHASHMTIRRLREWLERVDGSISVKTLSEGYVLTVDSEPLSPRS